MVLKGFFAVQGRQPDRHGRKSIMPSNVATTDKMLSVVPGRCCRCGHTGAEEVECTGSYDKRHCHHMIAFAFKVNKHQVNGTTGREKL
jgi:hypothetical protein